MQNFQAVQPLVIALLETGLVGPDLIAKKLSHFGYSAEMILVKDVPGLEAALAQSPDLILADLNPDGLNAQRGLDMLRSNRLDIPLIVLITEEQQEIAQDCLASGAADYLLAADLPRLGHSIGQILRSRQLNAELTSARVLIQSLQAARPAPSITPQERIETDLRETNQLLQTIIESSPLAISVIDQHRNLKLWSPAAERLFGWSAEEVLGHQLPIIPAEQMDEISQMIDEELKGQARTGLEGYRVRKDGARIAVRLSTATLRDSRGRIAGSMAMYEDIIERKQVELELRESEQKFRALVEQSPDGILLEDEQGSIIEWNRAIEEISGYTREQVIGRPIWDVQAQLLVAERRTPERLETIKQTILAALHTGQHALFGQPIESTIQRADGEKRFTQQIVFPLPTREGFRIGSIIHDITERKQAETAMRESQALLDTIINSTSDLIWSVNAHDFGLMLFNQGMKDFFCNNRGMQIETGMTPEELLPPIDGIQLWRELYQRALNEGAFVTEYLTMKGGFTLLLSLQPLKRDGEVFGISIFGKDITEKKRAENELREQKEILQKILDHIPLMINLIQKDGFPLFVNRELERTLGWSQAEIQDRNVNILAELYPDPAYRREVLSFISTSQLKWKDFKTRVRDGRVIDTAWTEILLSDGTYIGIGQDITERKRAEEAVIQSEKKYRALFSQMTSGCALNEMIYDAEGQPVDYITLDVNAAYLSFLNTTFETVIDKKASQILPGEELKKWVEIFAPVASDGQAVHYEMYSPLNEKYFAGTAYSTEKGKFAVIFTDVTLIRQSEKALRESEARFRTLIEKAPVAIIISRAGIPIYGNPLALKMLGYPDTEEFLRVPIAENFVLAHQEASRERARLRKLGLTTQDDYESILVRRDGFQFPVHVSVASIQLSDGLANMAIFSDISAQKQAEDEIRRQAAYANALVDLTSRLSTAPDLGGVLQVLCEELMTVLNLSICAVYLFDEQARMLSPTCNYGIPPGLWARLPALHVLADNAAEFPDQAFSVGEREQVGISGLSLNPMVYQDQLVGAVAIPAPDFTRVYPAEELTLVQSFARQAAIAIINLRLFKETHNRAKELEDLAEVSSSLRQARTLTEMVPLLIAQTVQVMHADHGTLCFFPEGRFTLEMLHNPPQPSPEWLALLSQINVEKIPFDAHAYFYNGRDSGTDDETAQVLWHSTPIAAFALAIIKSVEDLIGFLCVGYRQPHTFQEDEKRLLVAIAEMAGNAIHRSNIMDTLEQRVQVRTRELEALYDIARLTSGSIDLNSILDQSLDRVLEIYHVKSGLIQLLTDDCTGLELAVHRGLSGEAVHRMQKTTLEGSLAAPVIYEKQAFLSLDLANDQAQTDTPGEQNRAAVYLGAPIRAKGEVLGVVSIYSDSLHRFNVEEIALLETIANQIGVAVESDRLRRQSEQAAILEERQRLARDLHDSVTQSLFSLNLLAEGYRQRASQASSQELDEWFAELGASAHQALKDMRLLLYELRPSSIQQDGLVTVIQRRLDAVEGRSEVKSRFRVVGDPGLLKRMEEIELYHIVQEALNNSLKHAFASEVEIRLSVRPNRVQLEINDNGVGFDMATAQSGGMGMVNMAERAKRLGGNLVIQAQLLKGTQVKFVKEGKK